MDVASVEGPIILDSALRKVARGFDVQRLTAPRANAMQPFVPRRLVVATEHGSWLFPAELVVGETVSSEFTWYRPTASSLRKVQEIAPHEIANAYVDLVRQGLRVERSELVNETLGVFGYVRKTREAQAHADVIVDWSISQGYLHESGGYLVIPD